MERKLIKNATVFDGKAVDYRNMQISSSKEAW